jgi:hypothetical protein
VLSTLPGMSGNGVTEAEAGAGIKEALGNGVIGAVLQLNKTDGFLKMLCIKFYFPRCQKDRKHTQRFGYE